MADAFSLALRRFSLPSSRDPRVESGESYNPRELYIRHAVLLGENPHRLRPDPLIQLGPIVLGKKSWN